MNGATLAERAAGLAGQTPAAPLPEQQHPPQPAPDDEEPAPGAYPTPDQVPAHVAWYRVMCDVRAIAKNRAVTTGPAKFSFRGIEDVVQAFSASVRRHGVIVAPIGTKTSYVSSTSKNGGSMRECDVVVTWAVIGPMGDMMPTTFETAGEAVDYSDKATTKAQSIAHRTLLLTLGMVPVNDPDPEVDSAEIERGDPSAPSAHAYLAELTNPYTTRERFRTIHNELGAHRLMTAVVEHDGVKGELGALLRKIGSERWPVAKAPEHTGDHTDGFGPECALCRQESADIDRQASEDQS